MSDWTKALNEALLNQGDKIPAGWKTAKQIKAECKRGQNGTQRLLNALIKSGKAEAKKFRTFRGNAIRLVMHYRLR